MLIASLRTAAFRNLEDAEVCTAAKDIFLVGENGQGKTNFLEALYFCSYASSFRGVRDGELARNGEKDFSASVSINSGQRLASEVLVKFEKNKKTVAIDGKRLEDRKDLLSVAPCIVFCHEDMEFVSGTPERRRWFFDQVISLCDPVYLDDLRRYRQVLKTRNAVLKDNASAQRRPRRLEDNVEQILDVLDAQFAEYGVKLMEQREKAARLFSAVFGPLYEEVSGIAGIEVQYLPSWKLSATESSPETAAPAQTESVPETSAPAPVKFELSSLEVIDLLRRRRHADLATGISLSGPHRDRYVFARGGEEFAGKASTGQRRLLALLLRVAQARRFREITGKNPVLLLDDVLLEMDGEKRRRFLSVLPGYDQAFYTFLPEEPYQRYRKDDTLVYTVRGGKVMAQTAQA